MFGIENPVGVIESCDGTHIFTSFCGIYILYWGVDFIELLYNTISLMQDMLSIDIMYHICFR
ncbi:hypothetical protein COEU31_02250 [Coprococcus eutactus]|uniref:Uncharacterized protein n=1 Tax=Coprococcus eutactus TaxID=33043 RepID=A0AAI9K2L6_9FIRM|nr:hypothetical protein COEU31_02250 [Coprococcus eutactus]